MKYVHIIALLGKNCKQVLFSVIKYPVIFLRMGINAHHKTYTYKHTYHRCSALAYKGQRNAYYRHYNEHHSYI